MAPPAGVWLPPRQSAVGSSAPTNGVGSRRTTQKSVLFGASLRAVALTSGCSDSTYDRPCASTPVTTRRPILKDLAAGGATACRSWLTAASVGRANKPQNAARPTRQNPRLCARTFASLKIIVESPCCVFCLTLRLSGRVLSGPLQPLVMPASRSTNNASPRYSSALFPDGLWRYDAQTLVRRLFWR